MSDQAFELDDPELVAEESTEVGFLVSEQTGIQSAEGSGADDAFFVMDDEQIEALAEGETVYVITDVPGKELEVPEESLEEAFVLDLGRGPQGPPGGDGDDGAPGLPGPEGPAGPDVGDIPDLVLIFENGLI